MNALKTIRDEAKRIWGMNRRYNKICPAHFIVDVKVIPFLLGSYSVSYIVPPSELPGNMRDITMVHRNRFLFHTEGKIHRKISHEISAIINIKDSLVYLSNNMSDDDFVSAIKSAIVK